MSESQKRAVRNYRSRLSEQGFARFDIVARRADGELVKALARRLAADTPEASRLREIVRSSLADDVPGAKGGILAALRRSPLVGADLDLSHPSDWPRPPGI